ncbi:hypothetical protein ABT086_40835, partial [Streptomyces mirabilis]
QGRVEKIVAGLGHMGKTSYHLAMDAVIDHEDRQSAEDLHPHGGRRAHGQRMSPGGEQHTQHGEHGRAQTPHRQGHVHVTRCRRAAGESLPFTAHPHHRHVLPGQTAPLYESDADPVQFPGDQNAAWSRP